jgi:hypothetical protein
MRRTITTTLLAVLLLAGGATACSDDKSYEEITADCVQALKDRPEGDKAKPEACEEVKEDDYQTLLMSHILEEEGLVKDGEVDMDKLLDDATATP